MARKAVIVAIIIFSILLSILPAAADDTYVLETGELSITPWHVHYSRYTFSVSNPGFAILRVTKVTPDKDINGGFLFLNRRTIPLKHFFKGQELTFERKIKLRSLNHLNVFLEGHPTPPSP